MFKLLILANEQPNDQKLWEKACSEHSADISYRAVDLTKRSWLEDIKKEDADYLLAKPGAISESCKQLYDERLQILVNEMGFKVFPSLNEVLIYENKRYLSFWLAANGIPHPETHVFYSKNEAVDFIATTRFPFVAKLNIGASGNGVTIIRTVEQAKKYIKKIFAEGISPRTGPRLDRGRLLQRAFHLVFRKNALKNKLALYKSIAANPQRGFCLFQEFIPHNFEWRVVRIGDSFFAHKKIVKGEKSSGSLLKRYESPPLSLLYFIREITEKHHFQSQAIDVFEIIKDTYLVNEMQCIFGQSDPYQMMINGIPGRYVFIDDHWVFEAGMFNANESYNLRVETVMKRLLENK